MSQAGGRWQVAGGRWQVGGWQVGAVSDDYGLRITSYAASRRPRTTGYLEDIAADLRTTIRRYLERFWAAGIGGADFFMSAIGPGLSVYSRYARVERYDGSRVEVSDFLDLVRHEVAAFAIERIVGEQGFSERLDPATQFYVLWRWGYNDWDVPNGEAVLLSQAVGIELNTLMERVGLVARVKDKLRLLGRPSGPSGWPRSWSGSRPAARCRWWMCCTKPVCCGRPIGRTTCPRWWPARRRAVAGGAGRGRVAAQGQPRAQGAA